MDIQRRYYIPGGLSFYRALLLDVHQTFLHSCAEKIPQTFSDVPDYIDGIVVAQCGRGDRRATRAQDLVCEDTQIQCDRPEGILEREQLHPYQDQLDYRDGRDS